MATVRVLLEGASDVAAVRALARIRHLDRDRMTLVNLRGVTNVRRELTELRQDCPDAEIVGLCDAGEARFVERALAAVGCQVLDADDLSSFGFFVCNSDLEEELIRALGADRVIGVVERIGLGAKFAALQRQPAWRGQSVEEQLHRFCGVASGRKELLAGILAAELTPQEFPEPLAQLLCRVEASTPG